jgi:hypothetical protein
VRDEDVDDEDIKTVSYSVTPQYSYPSPCPPGALCAYRESSPRITGYQVSQTVEVKVRDLDQVGTLLAGLGSRNVQNLYGPDFALDDPKEAQAEAREMAIDEAQAEAKLLARQLGVRLVRIVNFSDSGNYPIYYAREAYGFGGDTAVAQSAPAPDIPQGEQEYSSYVTITYEIR